MVTGPALEDLQRAALAAVTQDEVEAARGYAGRMRNRAELERLWAHSPAGFSIIELAGTARIGQCRASTQLSDATRLVELYGATLALMDQGRVFVPAIELLLSLTRACTEQVQVEVERRLLTELTELNTTDLRPVIERTVLQVEADLDEELTAERLDRARRNRSVWTRPMPDGMCQIGADLDVFRGRRWSLDFEELVRAQKITDRQDGIARSTNQVRADLFAELPGRLIALIQAIQHGQLSELLDLARSRPDLAEQVENLAAATTDLTPDTDPDPDPADTGEPAGADPDVTVDDDTDETVPADPCPVDDPPTGPEAVDNEVTCPVAGDGRPGLQVSDDDWDGGPEWLARASVWDPPPPRPSSPAPPAGSPPEPPAPSSGSAPRPSASPRPASARAPEPCLDWLATLSAEQLTAALLRLPVRDPRVLNVHIPMSTLLDLDHRSGLLEGVGVVPAQQVRLLLPVAGLRALYVDHASGVPLGQDPQVHPPVVPGQLELGTDPDQQSADQQSAAAQAARDRLLSLLGPAVVAHRAEPQHDPSAALTRDVEVRDLRCTGIGCTQPARKCDLDHQHRHPEGPTAAWNLSAKSRRCHTAKHHGWTVTHHPNGHTLWRSPLGHSYTRPGVWQAPPQIPRHLTLPPAHPTHTDDHDPRPLDLPLWDDPGD